MTLVDANCGTFVILGSDMRPGRVLTAAATSRRTTKTVTNQSRSIPALNYDSNEDPYVNSSFVQDNYKPNVPVFHAAGNLLHGDYEDVTYKHND